MGRQHRQVLPKVIPYLCLGGGGPSLITPPQSSAKHCVFNSIISITVHMSLRYSLNLLLHPQFEERSMSMRKTLKVGLLLLRFSAFQQCKCALYSISAWPFTECPSWETQPPAPPHPTPPQQTTNQEGKHKPTKKATTNKQKQELKQPNKHKPFPLINADAPPPLINQVWGTKLYLSIGSFGVNRISSSVLVQMGSSPPLPGHEKRHNRNFASNDSKQNRSRLCFRFCGLKVKGLSLDNSRNTRALAKRVCI